MRGPFFNEISVNPLCTNDQDVEYRIGEFVKVLEFCGFLGFKKVRMDKPAKEIELKKGFFLKNYLAINAKGNNSAALLVLNMLKPPCIEDGSEEERKYAAHTARLIRDDEELVADGFACAYYSSGFVVGFASDPFWIQNTSFTVSIVDDVTKKSRNHSVFCISQVEHFGNSGFISWAINNLPIEFRCPTVSPMNKQVSLRDDHGKDKLMDLSQKILKEPYVVQVVNSLPFKHDTQKKTRWVGDGLIEVRLLDDKNKIGIALKTIARTETEAAYISADIERKYL